MEILLLSVLAAFAFIILIAKTGKLGTFAKFGWQTDLIISIILGAIFFGTFTGMMIAIIAGIIISLFLTFIRAFLK